MTEATLDLSSSRSGSGCSSPAASGAVPAGEVASEHTGSAAAGWRRWLVDAALSALAALLSPCIHGYAFGIENQRIQLPHLHALQDPTLYPGDPLIEAMGGYFSWFWPLMACLTEQLPLEASFFTGHLLINFVRFLGVLALGRALFPGRPRAAFVGLWFLFFGQTVIGYESLNWTYLAHTTLASALGVWVLVAALRGAWLSALLGAGLVFDIQAMQAAYLLLAIGAAALVSGRAAVARCVLAAPLFVAAALPGLLWMFEAQAVSSQPDLPLLVRTYFPAHFFPSSFGPAQWIAACALAGLFLWLCRREPPRPEIRRARAVIAALFVFWVCGGLAIELAPSGFVVKLHVFRSSALQCLILYVLLAGRCDELWSRWSARGGSRALPLACLALVATFSFAAQVDWTRSQHWMPLVSTAICSLVVLRAPRETRAWAAGGLVLCAGLLAGQVIAEHMSQQRSVERSLAPWRAVQSWARLNTEPGDRFLTPPYLSGFRVHSRRPVVGEIQDSSAMLWSADYADYWRTWFESMGGEIGRFDQSSWEQVERGWFEMDQAQIEQLARVHGARYLVLASPSRRQAARGWRLEWHAEPVFDNEAFRVYRVGEPAGPGAAERL